MDITEQDRINSFRDEYFFLSNFYEASVMINGILFQSNEAVFRRKSVWNAKNNGNFLRSTLPKQNIQEEKLFSAKTGNR